MGPKYVELCAMRLLKHITLVWVMRESVRSL